MNVRYDLTAYQKHEWKKYYMINKIRKLFFKNLNFFERIKYILLGKFNA